MEFPTCASVAVLYFLALVSTLSRSPQVTAIAGVDLEIYQELNITPSVLVESVVSGNVIRCARVHICGLSRLKLGSYSSAHRVSLVPSPEIQEKSYKKIQTCLHYNSSLGLCQCENDNWESIRNGMWSSIMTPYGSRYVDVKFVENLSGYVTVDVKEEFHRWRLLCLFIGFVLLLLAPIVSGWVPFYYSSSMAIGICLVIIIILFQGMKLLPTGRKTALYSTLYGLALGAGSYLLNRLSMFINTILINFGISEEMHNPVLIFILVGIVIAGAGFGYWLVRKFVVAEDGTVDVGIAQFVKWALRIIAVTFIFQSTLDTPLSMAMLACISGVYFSFTSMNWNGFKDSTYCEDVFPSGWSSELLNKKKRTEFLSRSGTINSQKTLRRNLSSSPTWFNSPVKGIISPSSRKTPKSPPSRRNPRSPSSGRSTSNTKDYYSSFHKTPTRKKYSEEEWKDFTEQSTREAIAELASAPEFTDWMVKNADRIRLHQEGSSDESVGSGSDSTDENLAESSSGRGLSFRRW